MGLVQRSFYGGVLILAIMVIRILWLDKLPKRTFPVLWSVALLRLLLPFSFSSVFSLYTFLGTAQPDQGMTGVWEGTAPTGNPAGLTVVQGLVQTPDALAAEGSGPEALWVIWCAGAVLCAAFFGAAYLRSLWNFRRAMPLEEGEVGQWLESYRRGRRGLARRISVRQSDWISAPLTYGWLRPVILLPDRALCGSGRELEYILQHESVHIRHHDAVLKLAMVAALCIHWFNPLVWVMGRLMSRDIELACDEGVLRCFGEQAKAGYAMALIGMEEKKRAPLLLYNGFSKNAIEERINLIMKYKKIRYAAMVASAVLVVSMALVFATSAEKAEATGNLAAGRGAEEDGAMALSGDSGGNGAEPTESYPSGGDGLAGNAAASGEDSAASSAMGEPGYTLRYMQEGMPQEEPACMYRGQDYCLLIPAEGWRMYAPDAWLWEANELVQFWVVDYADSTWEQAVARLEEEGYSQTGTDGVLGKGADGRTFYVKLHSNGYTVKGISYTYPADSEYEEGFGAALAAIAMNFSIVPETEEGEALSEDGRQAQQLAMAFWEAYLTGNREALGQYLAEGYSDDVDVFPDGVDGHVAQEAKVESVKGLDMGEKALGEEWDIWVEFRPAAGADHLEYLNLQIVKEQDGWKVGFYGLEL